MGILKNLFGRGKARGRPAAMDDAERAARERKALARWAEVRAELEKKPLLGGQAPVDPYVIWTHMFGQEAGTLVGTLEGRQWYDQVGIGGELYRIDEMRMIPPGATIFDFGCNQGVYTARLAQMAGPGGSIHAFDPFRLNAELTRINTELSGVKASVYEIGLSSKKGAVQVSQCGQSVVGSPDAPDPLEIRTDTPNAFAKFRPDFLKIDIEGAEIDALSAAGELLKHRPTISLSVHPVFFPQFGRRTEELADVLPLKDYEVFFEGGEPPGVQPFKGVWPTTASFMLYLAHQPPIRSSRAFKS